MKLSVIIVNYNVEHFLEQCLHSVRKAIKNIPAEVFVVDNNSIDGSVAMVREKFPEVRLIANTRNTGFSYANNQAIRASKGEYVLLLNPDTVVEEDTFEKSVRFMDEHPDAGGLGVMMLDGKGNFLPESKRGLPTPAVAFYKIFGLARLFPRSKTFGRYHLGYLDKDQTHAVDVLAGAYMLLRRSVLDKVGLLDEDFFMYGEDVDLSYRITKGGYKNYYFAGTRIIHYKGESTKKSSVNYVFVFYRAMIIFARKHFSQGNARLFSFFINLAIYLRAAAAVISRFVKKLFLPLADAAVIYAGFYVIKDWYEHNIKFTEGGSYPPELMLYIAPSYIFLWLITVFFSGGYDRPVRLTRILRGVAVGTAVILVIYALLPESMRSSRALILMGSAWAALALTVIRLVLHAVGIKNYRLGGSDNKRVVIVGSAEECARVDELLRQTTLRTTFRGYVSPSEQGGEKKENTLGNITQLEDIVSIYKVDEVIFCAKDLPAQTIIDQMMKLGNSAVDYKIAPPESLSVIGSNSIDTSGDLYVIDVNSITKPSNRRNKRVVDVMVCLALLPALPAALFIVKKPAGLIRNWFAVLFGFKSWIGLGNGSKAGARLPSIKKGVLSPADLFPKEVSPETAERLNILYTKDYRSWNDVNIVLRAFRKLGG
ncbi:MAG: glycosyltransferase [Bacteroidota bacterium]